MIQNEEIEINIKVNNCLSSGYIQPSWSCLPLGSENLFSIDILKEGIILKSLQMLTKSYYIIGRNKTVCDITLTNPTISRVHCVLQYNEKGELFIYDMNTCYGTFLNGEKIVPRNYIQLKDGDVFKVAHSKKLFILNGPKLNESKINKNENEVYIENVSLLMQNKTVVNNESFWGIDNYEDEIYEYQAKEDEVEKENEMFDNGDIQEDLNKIKNKEELNDKQKELISLIEKVIYERDKVLALKDKLKSEIEDEREHDKVKKMNKKNIWLSKKVLELKNKIVSLGNKLKDSIKKHDESKSKFNKMKLKECDDGSSDDEYYDRTKQNESLNTNENEDTQEKHYEQLKSKLEFLIQQRNKLKDIVNKNKQSTLDSLDLFLINQNVNDNNETISSQKSISLQEQLELLNKEIKKNEELLNYISPFAFNSNKKQQHVFLKPFSYKTKPTPKNKVTQNKYTNSVVNGMKYLQEIQKQKQNADIPIKENDNDTNTLQLNIESNKNNNDTNNKCIDELPNDKETIYTTKSLFKEIASNLGNQNFSLDKYPKIQAATKLRELNKKTKRPQIELPDEKEYLSSLTKTNTNTNIQPKTDITNINNTHINTTTINEYNNNIQTPETQIDIFSLKDSSKWKEISLTSSSSFSKYNINNSLDDE